MAAKSKRDGVKCIKTDYNDNIDTSLVGLNKTYPVSNVFKMRQKSGSGRLVPFETIDTTVTSIYKANSNCTCFSTSEKRVHAWIKALAKTLC